MTTAKGSNLHVPTHPVRFVTSTALFDGHDAAINIMRRILQAPGPGTRPRSPRPCAVTTSRRPGGCSGSPPYWLSSIMKMKPNEPWFPFSGMPPPFEGFDLGSPRHLE